MDASKLRNSCICGNTLPYLECCGKYADPLMGAGIIDPSPSPAGVRLQGRKSEGSHAPAGADPGSSDTDSILYHGFRHGLHELSMALFPLRALYQAYWETLTREDYPHDLLMEDPDYGRSIVENFFWDHFVQYSDARPILRTAREMEGRELRLAHDILKWSYSPLWFYRVLERNSVTARLANMGNGKVHAIYHGGGIPESASALLTRILPFRGREFCGHTVLTFGGEASASDGPGAAGERGAARAESLLVAGCRELGVKPKVTLRPDVHCEEWRRHGAAFLALWRADAYDSVVGRPGRGSPPAPSFEWSPPDPGNLHETLASSPDAVPAGPGQWGLRFRGLRLARMEIKGEALSVTPSDQAFGTYVREWLHNHLGGDTAAGMGGAGAMPQENPASRDAWVQAPLDALNGQSPLQASAHDWGRHRLQSLFREMEKQGMDVAPLKGRLGL